MSEVVKYHTYIWGRESGSEKNYLIWCAACGCGHLIPTPRWNFSGTVESPTFTPSVKITAPPSNYCCHFNITGGKILYHGDCSHSLKGQTIDMLDIPPDYGFN